MSEPSDIHVGDLVQFHYGRAKVVGVVKEDRGPIGLKGRRLYLIDFSTDPDEASQIELPAELLERPSTWAILNFRCRVPFFEKAQNVTSVTDNGIGADSGSAGFDLTLTFDEPFSDALYACQVSANRDVKYRVLTRTTGSVRLVIEDPIPVRVKVVCSHT